MAFLAGAYSATYGGAALGTIDDGFELEWSQTIEDILSDSFRARQDGVFQGIEMQLRFVLNEPLSAGVAALAWPWDATEGKSGVVGRLMTSMAQALVLTKCTGNAASPTTLTFTRAVLWTDPVTTKFSSEQRKVAVNVAILPVPISTTVMGCAGGTFYTAV